MNDRRLNLLTQIIPIIRGLLAEATGEQDIPFKPVILKSLTNKEAIDFANSAKNAEAQQYPAPLVKREKPPLFLDAPDEGVEAEKLRKHLSDAISDYSARQNGKPEIICVRDLGILYVGQVNLTKAHVKRGKEPPVKLGAKYLAPRSTWGLYLPLHNKIALVTGAAGAIGYGICRGLLEAGCYLAATDLPGKKFDDFIADLKQIDGDRVLGVPLDVTDKESVSQGFQSVIQTWGGIDIVVVNAGIPLVSYLKDIDLDAFRKLENVNVEGALLTLAEAAQIFIAQGTGGDIIIISTKNVPSPGAGFGAYSATKAACHQLGRIASIELAQYGVRVNMVAPDGVFSEGKYKSGLWEQIGPERMRVRGLDEKGLQEYYQSRNLLKAKITGRHVANVVLFFVTRQTPTTGATIPVDGGLPDATPR
jgi:NAD(P)-dependent dehydrogenase (short-subunit alcohol dehydrogenase family)